MWDLPTVSYHPAKSDDHRYCRSADISFLNLSHDRVIKRLRDFEDCDPPPQVISYKCRYKILHFSLNHIIKRSHDLEGGVPQPQVATLSSLVVIGVAEEQI